MQFFTLDERVVIYVIRKFSLYYGTHIFLISNFRRVLNALCFLLGNSAAPEFYVPTFRNTLFHLYRRIGIITIHL